MTLELGLLNCGFHFVIRGFELLTRGFELVTRGSELALLNFNLHFQAFSTKLLSRNSYFTISQIYKALNFFTAPKI